MKALGFITAAGLLALPVWFLARSHEEGNSPEFRPATIVADPPTTTSNDAAEVFKRAFWRRPGLNDTILHAERREWSGPDGVDRWQWFIAVDPSPELAKYLLEQNPFSLVEPDGAVTMPSKPLPQWFPKSAESFKVRQSPDGGMMLMIDSDGGSLYATGQGHGFTKAVEIRPAPPTGQGGRIGRLPDSPPVIPEP